ncbi:MAG TPA: sarcosine oxidase subunit delta, partial [Ensifer sp.]|nr:sarcosine oxidase subunit delta [Ensifer sp.]
MLLIYCPYCEEERSELEFRGAGDAHIARPENIADITDEQFEEYFFLRQNP